MSFSITNSKESSRSPLSKNIACNCWLFCAPLVKDASADENFVQMNVTSTEDSIGMLKQLTRKLSNFS